jgi:hypothetical protein
MKKLLLLYSFLLLSYTPILSQEFTPPSSSAPASSYCPSQKPSCFHITVSVIAGAICLKCLPTCWATTTLAECIECSRVGGMIGVAACVKNKDSITTQPAPSGLH